MAKVTLPSLLKTMVDQNASDLHITAGVPPQFRINGNMVKAKMDALNQNEAKELCYSVLTDAQKAEFEKNFEIDFSFGIKDLSRFRGNIFFQRGGTSSVFRRIPMIIPDFDSLGLPEVLKKIVHRPNGLVLVTGPTGSGKTTSLAAMLDILNREEFGHIITIEDPIEFVHPHKNCIINQREVGVDTKSFATALRRILRQDPDYVLVGELRDAETIEMALTLAETGHLVFATLHTNGAIQSINRIINVFPPHQQEQIRQVLSFTLQAIVSQQLIPKSFEPGLAIACEVLIPTMGIRNLIREDKVHQIYSAMQAGQEKTGMQTMNQALIDLVNRKVVSKNEVIEYTTVPDELTRFFVVDRK
ncbi:MAG: type IV pili twitching motility protein PilT [Bdellovibrionales bacterium RIFOXYC1_FULL_54_43]|nr:MAG: type IV pili twitching motility protein PilT [Bdellovibrionales bacterium RIFOXYC1_FULL_54_43]OFZ79790.1 MAG: type IV pili twitching motility protein PilT [Bdellovibrionales bacterium RIFOXYD1_FULL_55_31]